MPDRSTSEVPPAGPHAVSCTLDGRSAHVVIERADRLNALSPAVIDGLSDAIAQATALGVSVLTLRGRGGTVSAGADLAFLRSVLDDAAALRAYIASIGDLLDRLQAAPFVSVCVLDGYAVAGGCEILLACDLAVVTDRSRIGDRHLEYGLLPGAGGSVRLSRALPPALARRFLYTGEMIDGATAAEHGLVSHLAPPGELESTVAALVARLSRHDPAALMAMKHLHRTAVTVPADEAQAAEREVLLDHLTGPAAAEGLAAFAQHRPPVFATPVEAAVAAAAAAPDEAPVAAGAAAR
jgi:enoyl-CoA hydratase/carnithine racemase